MKEVEDKTKEILEYFDGLIDEETAEMLAKYFHGFRPKKKLSEIIGKSGFFVVEGEVIKVYPVRRLKRRRGKVATVIVKGDVEAKLNLWNEAAILVEKKDIFEGVRIKVRCYSKNGELHVSKADDVEISTTFTEIAKLIPGDRVCISGRVSGIGDPDRANEIYVSDESGRVRVILWDDKKGIFYKVDLGDCIELLNALVKIGKDGEIEVHIGRNSKVRLGE